MSAPATVQLGTREIGAGRPVLVIAEAGVNHDGDLDSALALVDAAAMAGADAVKFQTFEPAQLVSTRSELASYQRTREPEATSQLQMLSRLQLGATEHKRLAAHCRERGIVFLSTPFDRGSAALLDSLAVPAFKVGSGELTNLPFLAELARYRRPILLSTGMSDLEEVGAAVQTVQGEGAPLILLHCVSSYPAPDGEANLRAIATLTDEFRVPVGYSDHCLGLSASLAAVAAGACVLERHFTLDRTRPGPDHAMSLEPGELRELVAQVRAVEAMLGDGRKRPQPSELELRVAARRSIVVVRALPAGHVLTAADLAIKRPADGLPPARLPSLIGRRLSRAIGPDEAPSDAHLDPLP